MDETNIYVIREKVDRAAKLLADGDLDACFMLCGEMEEWLKDKPSEKNFKEALLARIEVLRLEMNRRMVKNIRDKNTLERNI
jgi:hypothetical protein